MVRIVIFCVLQHFRRAVGRPHVHVIVYVAAKDFANAFATTVAAASVTVSAATHDESHL